MAHPSRHDVVRIPGRPRDARRASASGGRFGWDNEFGEVARRRSRLRDRRPQRDQRRVPRVRRGRRLSHARAVDGRRLGVARERAARASRSSGCSATASGTGAACSRSCRCRWRGRSTSARRRRRRSRAGGGAGCRPRRSTTAPRSERRTGASGCFRGATRRRTPSRGNFDFSSWEPVPAGSRPAGASAWGVHDLVGNGWEWTSTIFGPFPGFAPMASYPEYSADFFDGQHFVMKGASPATATRARAPQLPQLVPAQLPVRVRDVPHRCRELATMAAINQCADRSNSPRTFDAISRSSRSSSSRSICTTRSARASSRRSAGCRGIASRAPRAACSRMHATRSSPRIADDDGTIVELGCGSGEKLVLLAEALQARGGTARVHLIDISSQALEQTEQTARTAASLLGRRSSVAPTKSACGVRWRTRRGGGPMLVLLLGSNIGNFDRRPPQAFLRGSARALAPGDLAAARRRSREAAKPTLLLAYDDPLGVTAAFNRNLLVRINRELRRRLRSRRVRAPRGLEPRAAAHRDAPGQRVGPDRAHSGRRLDCHASQRRADLDRELVQVHGRPDRRHGGRGELCLPRPVGRRRRRIRLDALHRALNLDSPEFT